MPASLHHTIAKPSSATSLLQANVATPYYEEGFMKPGRYRHYKGQQYVVLGVARHSETEEELVVYRQDYGSHGLWVRPKSMFLESVEVEGRPVPRFEYLGPGGD